MVQTDIKPPTFLIFINNLKLATEEFTNFIEGILRRNYVFLGTPIRIKYRRKR